MTNRSRPILVVEIDQDLCELSYGEGDCTAVLGTTGDYKCFNTYATCQAQGVYSRGSKTLRFIEPHADAFIAGINFFPFITNISMSAMELNPAGANTNTSPLGKRESVTITMRDAPHNDSIVDPYFDERDYDATAQGTFWSKWLARNPFYLGRKIRILEGFAGQSLSDFTVRHYIISSVSPPTNSGVVTIKAVDIIRKTDVEKAKYPLTVDCTLAEDIDEDDDITTIDAYGDIDDWTVDDDIISYQYLRIGDECFYFGGVTDLGDGEIQFTDVSRVALGTTASSASEDDTIFRCVTMTGYAWRIAAWLIKYATTIDESYVDVDEWDDECLEWISMFEFNTTLVEADEVNTLLAELSQQALFYLWWNTYEEKIEIKPIQPPTDDVYELNDLDHIIQDSYKETVDDDSRISQTWVYYNYQDITDLDDSATQYKNVLVRTYGETESDNQYGEASISEIYSRWITTSTQALTLANRIMIRYGAPPSTIQLDLDIKDNDIGVTDLIDVSHRNTVDFYGAATAKRYEVISKSIVTPNHTIRLKAQIYDFGGATNVKLIYLSPDTYPDEYEDATQTQKNNGFWFADDDGLMPDGTTGYRYF